MPVLHVEIVTPESSLWEGDATALIARSSDGNFTILPEHTAVIGDLVPGVLRVETAEGELSFVEHGGYFQVNTDHDADATTATVLVGTAERTSDIDVARAEAAKATAEAALAATNREGDLDDAVLQSARDALARAELRLGAAK